MILSYLDDATKMDTARCISRSWYHCVVNGHACLALKTRGTNFYSSNEEMRLQGRISLRQQQSAPTLPPCGERRKCVKRTRGHLQEPCMDFLPSSSTERWAISIPLSRKRKRATTGSSIVRSHPSLLSLDLNNSTGGTHIVKTNLSSVHGLKVVSARGCRYLTHLSLPPTLLGLDASSCLHLKQILFPVIQKQREEGASSSPSSRQTIQSLNLSGCRSLHSIETPNPTNWAGNLQEVDLSSCLALNSTLVVNLLGAAASLKSVSLRYVATDEILLSLPHSSLQLGDVAFSQQVTDKGVHALLDNAVRLQRLNLRACRGVSSECYNGTPLLLQQRLEKKNKEGAPNLQEMAPSRRKGDNLFQLLVTNEPKKKRVKRQQQGKEATKEGA